MWECLCLQNWLLLTLGMMAVFIFMDVIYCCIRTSRRRHQDSTFDTIPLTVA
jgi:hypothetical protein